MNLLTGMNISTPHLKAQIMQRIAQDPVSKVWTPGDFLDLGGRDVIDKTLQRLVTSNVLRRIDRGLYDQPRVNRLSGQIAAPDYQYIIDAISRRHQIRVLIDGMTAANDLGLTNAVPGRVIVHTDGRLRPIVIGNLALQFKLTAPGKLYWAGRPAMRVVQALYWLRNELKSGTQVDQGVIRTKLIRLLNDAAAKVIRDDLLFGLHNLPAWMQKWVRELLAQSQRFNMETS